jgi:outer membrane protein OmpA-like peptidoglycan-associated protein
MRTPSLPSALISRRSLLLSVAGALAAWLVSRKAAAQDAADINEIIKGLAPIEGQSSAGGFKPRNPRAYVVEGRSVTVDLHYQRDFEIYFDYDSARIAVEADTQLRPLGRSLESPDLSAFSYLLAGHTDSAGSAAYNLALSVRRAQAVKAHLLKHYAIDADRLVTTGFGEQQLKFPENPLAASNRRVQVLLIVP